MYPLIILHTNDIHGRVEGLARIATLIEQTRAENPGVPVLYFDAGDIEEPSSRLSNLTKGAAMHRLLSLAGCAAAVAGNGAWLRYGPQVLAEHGRTAHYPLLLANLRRSGDLLPAGVQPTATLDIASDPEQGAGRWRLGLIGMTADMPEFSAFFDLSAVPAAPLVRELAAALRQDGADAVIVLSHMSLKADRELAAELQNDVTAIIGAHSHDLLPEGERVGQVLVAQAGQYAEQLGRLDLAWDGERLEVIRASMVPVTEATPPSPRVLAEVEVIEAEVAHFLAEIIGEIAAPLDFALDRECGVADLMADVLRKRMSGELAVVAAGQAFTGPLPAGPLRRGTLWDVCSSTANPAITTLTGAQLCALMTKGLDPDFAAERPHTLRGQQRGLFHLSGAEMRDGALYVAGEPVDPARAYRVACSDWEFEPYGGYAEPAWGLRIEYDVPTILREALENYLAAHRPVRVGGRRLG